MDQARTGQVRQQHTKSDRQQQKRLKLFDDREVQQHTRNNDHHQVPGVLDQPGKAGLLHDACKGIEKSLHSSLSPLCWFKTAGYRNIPQQGPTRFCGRPHG
ncbi:hypothetical protein SDC9_177554 [bioreactor metagenome]|uniref:Uncharacterized protein n=1 Tax=bioreactor metagenome TaxID=1076179 RepID=A0A645GTE2_9ZZZZ